MTEIDFNPVSYRPISEQAQLERPAESVEKKRMEQDSIAPAPQPSMFSIMRNWFSGFFAAPGQRDTIAPSPRTDGAAVRQKPLIEPPARDAYRRSADLEEILEYLKSGELTDAQLERIQHKVLKTETENYQNEVYNETRKVNITVKEKERKANQLLDLQKSAAEKQKTSNIFSWVSLGSGATAGLLGLAAIGVTVATGGAGAFPLGLALASSGFGIIHGGTKIKGSLVERQGKKFSGDSIIVKNAIKISDGSVRASIQDIKNSQATIGKLNDMRAGLESAKPNIFR